MKIKRVDNKPMVIHTKQKAKLHVRALKKASIKGNKAYTISRNSKIKSDAGVAVKKKNSSIKVAGAVGTQAALSHMEGGDEIRDATCNHATIQSGSLMGQQRSQGLGFCQRY